MAKKIEIDMERVYKLREQYKTNKEIAEIFTNEGIEVTGKTINTRLKEKHYPIQNKENFKQMELGGLECFWVSRDGEIFNSRSQKFYKPTLDDNDYYITALCNNGVYFKYRRIHQIVYCVWSNIYNLDNKEIHHKDKNTMNNNFENLELVCKNHGVNYNNTKLVRKNINKIIEDYNNGLTSYNIADKWNVKNNFILKMLKDNGIKIREGKPQKIQLPICLLAMWRGEGLSYKRISKKLKEKCNIDVGWQTIYNRLKEYYENNN